MLVTLFGMVMLVKPVHQPNALFPMLVTLFGMVMLVKPVHQPNALSSMLVTAFPLYVAGITTSVRSSDSTPITS